jgi:autotransporter-associated beta strand protein
MTFTSGNILNLQSSGSIAGANTTLAAGSTEFILRTPQDLTVSALITTSGGLSKAGTGTLTFSSAKTYTGLTSINSGTLLYGINDAINTGNVTVHDATLNMATYNDTVGAVVVQGGTITGTSGVLTATSYDFRASTISAIIGGSGTTTISNTNERVDAVTVLSRDNTYTGTTSIASGILKLGAAGGGTNTPLGTTAGATSITNGAMLDLNGYSLGTTEAINTFRGTGIAGQGAIINSSVNPATYQGALTIATSARIGADFGKITISGSISGAGLPLTVGGFGDIDITGVIGTTTGTVTKDGFGTYTPSNNNTYSGVTTISVGRLKLGGTGSGTDTPLGVVGGATSITNAAGASLDLNGYTLVTAEPLTVNGIGAGTGDFASGAVLNSGSAVTYSGPVTLGASSMICGSSRQSSEEK